MRGCVREREREGKALGSEGEVTHCGLLEDSSSCARAMASFSQLMASKPLSLVASSQ